MGTEIDDEKDAINGASAARVSLRLNVRFPTRTLPLASLGSVRRKAHVTSVLVYHTCILLCILLWPEYRPFLLLFLPVYQAAVPRIC